MKVGLVTFNRAYNYGAVLQCYALAKCIVEICDNCEVIDYQPAIFMEQYKYKVKFNIQHPRVKLRLKRILFMNVLNKRIRNFENFIDRYINYTNKTYTSWNINEYIETDCDCYITGSDQVWNNKCAEFDPVYFLDFPDARKKKRYSYAASFGMTELPEELKDEYKRRLIGYDAYSVRERSGVSIIKDLVGREAAVNCDPTLLLGQLEWRNICEEIANSTDKYILVYYTSMSKMLFDYAEKLSKEKNMKVISLPCNMSKDVLRGKLERQYGFESAVTSGPKEFLALFRDAEYVLTNTFHGTVFSIIFNKQFLTQMQSETGKKNTRVYELFNEIGMTERALEKGIEMIDEIPNWYSIEQRILEFREKSMDYLLNIVKNK